MSDSKNIESCRDCKKASLCFQSLYPEELEFINNKKKQLIYQQGENLFKQGAFAPYVIHIIGGLIKIYLQTSYEKQVNIRVAKAGDFLAFSSVFDENIFHYSAMAIKDSTICMIEKDGLKQLLLKNPDFAMRITSKNCSNESRLLEIIKNISYKQMRGKLASALLYLTGDEFAGEDVFQYLTRQDLADFASISTASAIKFLKEFEKEGIVKLNGKAVIITNKEKISEFARKG